MSEPVFNNKQDVRMQCEKCRSELGKARDTNTSYATFPPRFVYTWTCNECSNVQKFNIQPIPRDVYFETKKKVEMSKTTSYHKWLVEHLAKYPQEMITYMETFLTDTDGYDELRLCVEHCIDALRLREESNV